MKMLWAAAMAAGGCVAALATQVGYPQQGTVAPAYTFTATTSGDELAYFYGNTAEYINMIGVRAGAAPLVTYALNNHTSSFGQVFDFGYVTAGEPLEITLEVLTKGYILYSDPEANLDGANHIYTSSFAGRTKNGVTIPAGTFISFEDLLLPRSNLNYNDEDVVFSDVTATAVTPEPDCSLLLALGLAVTGWNVVRERIRPGLWFSRGSVARSRARLPHLASGLEDGVPASESSSR